MPKGQPPGKDPNRVVRGLREHYRTGATRPLAYRKGQLLALEKMLREQEAPLMRALASDLGKPEVESISNEIGFVRRSARQAATQLKRWARSQGRAVPLLLQPGAATLTPEPLGTVLIIAAWNYPVNLLLEPAIGAIAAGNCVVLKPSELAPATADLIAEIAPTYLDPAAVQVFQGGPAETAALLTERFDHILYTGGARVGRLVLQAAAKNLTPVTLELGGKCPAIVTAECDIRAAANRIAWGKFNNAGQTCIAPDYVMATEPVADALCDALQKSIERMYGDNAADSEDYARIVSDHHFDRVLGLLEEAPILAGGRSSRTERYIEPTLVRDPDAQHPLATEEIFGPVLPVFTVSSFEQAIESLRDRPKPLAAYLFSNDIVEQDRFEKQVAAGTCCINDTVVFTLVHDFPFGGVGASGMGAYRGQTGFETFSHMKPTLRRSTRFETNKRYPPYDSLSRTLIRRLLG